MNTVGTMRRYAPLAVATSLMAALAAFALLASCGKETEQPSPQPALPTLESLVGTEWEGFYDTPVEYQGMTLTMRLGWTVDFLTDTSGSLLAEVSSQFSQTQYEEYGFTYTYDGGPDGTLFTGGESETFSVDAINQTLTIDLQTPVALGDSTSGQTILGGVTTLYRVK